VKQIRKRLTYANVMSSIAVFMVLGGAAVAATQLPKNSVGTKQLKKNAVKTTKIANNAVNGAKIADGSVTGAELADATVGTADLANGSVLTDKLANDSVLTDKILNNAVTNAKIANGAVNSAKLGAASVRAANLGPITIRTNSTTVALNSTDTVAVSCQAGEKLLGGGGGFNLITVAPHPQIFMSQAEGTNTWRVRAFNPSAEFTRQLTVQAFCLNV
jgi:hypothetical protein